MATIDQDTFVRSNITGNTNSATGWGTATGSPFNSTWAQKVGTTFTYAISSNVGTITTTTANGADAVALGTQTTADGIFTVKAKFSGSADTVGTCGRIVDSAANFYLAYLRPASSEFRIGKYVAGTFTQLATTTMSSSINTWYWVKLSIKGTFLQAKAWLDGNSEPAYMINATDSTHTGAHWFGVFGGISTTTSDVLSYGSFSASTAGVRISDGLGGLFQ